MLVWTQREEARLTETRALIVASLHPDKKAEPAIQAFEEYCQKIFPFLKDVRTRKHEREAKMLEAFVAKPLVINTGAIWQQKVQEAAKTTPIPMKLKPKYSLPGFKR